MSKSSGANDDKQAKDKKELDAKELVAYTTWAKTPVQILVMVRLSSVHFHPIRLTVPKAMKTTRDILPKLPEIYHGRIRQAMHQPVFPVHVSPVPLPLDLDANKETVRIVNEGDIVELFLAPVLVGCSIIPYGDHRLRENDVSPAKQV